MILHVLPGDAIVDTFKSAGIEGEISVCRECLVVGDVSGDTLPEFWENRARFLSAEHPDYQSDYHEHIVREFSKLTALQSGSEINLWFEYELFCNVNMWFCLSLLAETPADIFRIAPITVSESEKWDGFGSASPEDLEKCFDSRIKFSSADIELGRDLWIAFKAGDGAALKRLATIESPAFPYLREVCAAAIEKDSRPKKVVAEIARSGVHSFDKAFREFKSRAGVYGFGDSQVKQLWEDLLV